MNQTDDYYGIRPVLVTTAIDYPNALPHIGTAFEKIGADIYARFRRFQGREVYFSMGNDENTAKVWKAAQAKQQIPLHYCNEMAGRFKEIWKTLNISFDDFIQTTEERHKVGVQLFLQAVHKAGYIEKREYKGLYCEGCEEFKTKETCPNHPNIPLVTKSEENYFFLLSKFTQKIKDLITITPFLTESLLIEPPSVEEQIKALLDSGLEDISISRKNEGWGIPIPWDDSQVTYVWFDALLNYLTVVGFGTDWDKFKKFWPAEVHFIGKDITRFHCILFPAMIKAYNEGCGELPKIISPQRVFTHGFVLQKKGDQLVKASKSDNAITPMSLIDEFGTDAYRYYFTSKFNYDGDGAYSLEHFKEVYNADLANNLGNLVSRVVSLSLKFFDGVIPAKPRNNPNLWFNPQDLEDYDQLIVDSCSFRHALELVWRLISSANQYVEKNRPWDANTSREEVTTILQAAAANLRIVGLLLRPFMPETADKVYNVFNWDEPTWELLQQISKDNFLNIEQIVVNKRFLVDGKFQPLFDKIK